MQRVAAGDPADPEPRPPQQAEPADRVGRILRAARLKTTLRAQYRAHQFLVHLDGKDGGTRRPPPPGMDWFQSGPRSDLLSTASEIQETSVVKGTVATDGPAITTTSNPTGRPHTLMASRSLLFARLRTTALPNRRPATSPKRTLSGCPTARTTTKSPTRRRRPVARTVRKLAEERSETGLSGETLAAFCTP